MRTDYKDSKTGIFVNKKKEFFLKKNEKKVLTNENRCAIIQSEVKGTNPTNQKGDNYNEVHH